MAILGTALDVYSLVLLAAVILSWINLPDDNPLVRFTRAATEPVLRPIRRVIPVVAGFDLSAMVLLFVVRTVRGLLLTW